jgi:hypothetical protein
MRASIGGLLLAVGFAAASHAAPPAPSAPAADALFQSGKWAEAAEAYRSLTEAEPGSGRYWNRLGACRHQLADYQGAVAAYRKAVEIGGNPQVMYNLGCSYARLGDRDRALEWLNKALDGGFGSPEQLGGDADLASLAGDASFKTLLRRAEKVARPCVGTPEHRQFDFWIGEWDVRTSQGQPAGDSTIQLILGDCILLENWTGRVGGSGKSFNFYNSGTGKWQQTWVDDRAGVTEYVGGLVEREMRFTATAIGADGAASLKKLTFFNQGPDQVRQLGENSADQGKTWTVDYDLTYLRKK